MNVILLGPPGAGKGTQGAILGRRVGLPKIATGDLLRTAVQQHGPLGRKAQPYMDRGLLVPDEIVLGLIEEVLASPDAAGGVIMDGFPRTVGQAEAVDRLLKARQAEVDRVLQFVVPEDELVHRLMGRAAEEGRSDDIRDTIQQRLMVYRAQTEPLIAYYRDRGIVVDVEGTGTVDAIAERVKQAVG